VELTQEQWAAVRELIGEPPRRADGRGRPWRDTRAVLEGIVWVLRSGARWKDLPERFPPYQTCHRRFQQWVRSRVMRQVLWALAQDLHERGGIDLRECFIDGTFAPAKRGGAGIGKTKRGKGTKLMAVADGNGLPVAAHTGSAAPAEVRLVAATLEERFVVEPPQRLIGDKAYDSDGLDRELLEAGIELIAPNRANRRQPSQDRRQLRRWRRRWKVERLFAWLHNFRRLVVRWDRCPENFLGFIHLACILILLRRYL
jgi:transposase